jgi:hypothetical protein
MKKIVYSMAMFVIINLASAQTISFNPRTGDVEMDGFLKDINTRAKENVSNFIDNVTQTFSVAKNKVDELLKIMAPGDVYMAIQTADIIHKPVDEVAIAYKKGKDKGWGQVAKDLGIKPGSAEFHAMKDKMKGKDKGGKGNGHGKGNGKKK